jgi:glucose-1-phosphate adenylyltransferase
MRSNDTDHQTPLTRLAYAFVLAGGRGSRLGPMTDNRCKPAVYFGGKFRIIDFALSNCLNSGIRRIGVLTQYKSQSLLRHLQRGWSFLKGEFNEFVDPIPPQQRLGELSWYRGTADAVYQNMAIPINGNAEYVIVLAGDHIYKMNYAIALEQHVNSGAPCTVGCIEVPKSEATEYGVMAVDEHNKITAFVEKPADPPTMPGSDDTSLASMGIYIFDTKYLADALNADAAHESSDHDFGRNVIPGMVAKGDAVAQNFSYACVENEEGGEPYWRDVGNLQAYWEANLDLTQTTPDLNLYDQRWPIWTYQQQLPPAKFVHNTPEKCGNAVESLVSGGCIISGKLDQSLLFSRCRVHSGSQVDQSVLLPDVTLGHDVRLSQCVIDHRCTIPDGTIIGEDAEEDARRFFRTPGGVTLVTAAMLSQSDDLMD